MIQKAKDILMEQIQLLADWNKQHINSAPEQVSVNTQVISNVVKTLMI
jgi:hypothetical protein